MTPVNVQRVSDALKKKPAAINAIKSKSLALFFFFYMCVCVRFVHSCFFFLCFSLAHFDNALLVAGFLYTIYIYVVPLHTYTKL